MLASSERPAQDRRGPRWLRNGAIAALALVFAQPACFTSAVWRDDRSHDQVWRTEAPPLRTFRRAGAAEFFVEVPPAALPALQAMQPGMPPAATWLRVQPLAHEASVATTLNLAGSKGVDLRARLAIVEETDGQRSLRFRAYCMAGDPSNEKLGRFRALPGVARNELFSLFHAYELDVLCSFTAELAPPEAPGNPLLDLTFTEERILDDGTHVVKRLALTPFAVLGDVLMLPFEVWFLIATW